MKEKTLKRFKIMVKPYKKNYNNCNFNGFIY